MPRDADTPQRAVALVFDWVFRNRRTGHTTIAQRPNIALSVFIVTAILRRAMTDSTGARTTLEWISEIALATWAIDEVLRGVNPWRRALGLGGCAFAAGQLASLLR